MMSSTFVCKCLGLSTSALIRGGVLLLPLTAHALIAALLCLSSQANALDPFSIGLGVGGALTGGLIPPEAEDLLDMGVSFTGLMQDLEIDDSADAELKRKIGELRELESRARQYEDAALKVGALSDEMAQATRMRDQLETTREMIRLSKQIASMMGMRGKASEKALKIQDTRLNYMMLDELMALRRMEYESKLDQKMRSARVAMLLNEVKDEEEKGRK